MRNFAIFFFDLVWTDSSWLSDCSRNDSSVSNYIVLSHLLPSSSWVPDTVSFSLFLSSLPSVDTSEAVLLRSVVKMDGMHRPTTKRQSDLERPQCRFYPHLTQRRFLQGLIYKAKINIKWFEIYEDICPSCRTFLPGHTHRPIWNLLWITHLRVQRTFIQYCR